MQDKGIKASCMMDWLIAGVLALVTGLVNWLGLADYFYPGEGARLAVLWNGLDVSTHRLYPLFSAFAHPFVSLNASTLNAVMPLLSMVAVALLYFLVVAFLRRMMGTTYAEKLSLMWSRIGGAVAVLILLSTPAFRQASTHLEPRLFDGVWLMVALSLVWVYSSTRGLWASVLPALVGVMVGLTLGDTALVVVPAAFGVVFVWMAAKARGSKPVPAVTQYVIFGIVGAVIALAALVGDFSAYVDVQKAVMRQSFAVKNLLIVPFFTLLPFVVILLAARRGLRGSYGVTAWVAHILLTLMAILVYVSPLAPSDVLAHMGVTPILPSVCVAFSVAYLVVYWLCETRLPEDLGEIRASQRLVASRIGYAAGGVFAVILLAGFIIRFGFGFNANEGKFANQVADRVIQDMGARTWMITDGTMDDHLTLAAARTQKPLHLICLQRDLDKDYLKQLEDVIRAEKLGGSDEAADALSLSLSLGVWPFVQDWLKTDPSVKQNLAVFGTPDLWYYADIQPVPETLFFGADPSRFGTRAAWEADWQTFNTWLTAPKGWGSYRMNEKKVTSPIELMRYDLRRHLGLIANDRGFYHHNLNQLEDAFEMYDLVLKQIDSDNISALFNELVMANAQYPKARQREKELTARMQSIVADKNRRYIEMALSRYYGYIRDALIFVRLGMRWAQSGLPGEGLLQVKRAIDFLPNQQNSSVMNMLASLYAAANEQEKSREVYRSILKADANNREALMGLFRLEMKDGNTKEATTYLEQAIAQLDEKSGYIEKALLAMMKDDLATAQKMLRQATDENPSNLQAWSFLATICMRQIDGTKDAAERAKLERELKDVIIPAMDAQARSPSDYYLMMTKAFVLMRQETREDRLAARKALLMAAQANPGQENTQDLILSLDMQLNDEVDAERQAREVLRRNRQAPLANYVMGSLALRRGRYSEAEAFLRRSVAARKPLAMAFNDLAEVLRRDGRYTEAESCARRAIELDPNLYVCRETLGAVLLDAKRNLDEAEATVLKACEMSKDEKGVEADVRMLVTLARVQLAKGDKLHAKMTIRKVTSRMNELSEYERAEFLEMTTHVD